MTQLEKAKRIKIMCDKCGCSQKIREIHFNQFVNKHWNPHASIRFKNWWHSQPEFQDAGIQAVIAQNVDRIWEAYLEAKQIGIA